MRRVIEHGQFILGPEVAELERRLASFCGARALRHLRQRHRRAGAGADGARGEAGRRGVRAVLHFRRDRRDRGLARRDAGLRRCRSPTASTWIRRASSARSAWAKGAGLKPRAVIPVDLFGQPADYGAILPIAEKEGLFVLSDAAQSFGASLDRAPHRPVRARHRDQFLPGEAARLLWRRRRGLHRRRRARRASCARCACMARAATSTTMSASA